MSTLVLLVELTLNVGQKDAFLSRAREHRKNVLKNEPGCKAFELLAPTDGSETIFLYEAYADQAAIDHHMETPYMKEYMADTGSMIAMRTRTLCTLASE